MNKQQIRSVPTIASTPHPPLPQHPPPLHKQALFYTATLLDHCFLHFGVACARGNRLLACLLWALCLCRNMRVSSCWDALSCLRWGLSIVTLEAQGHVMSSVVLMTVSFALIALCTPQCTRIWQGTKPIVPLVYTCNSSIGLVRLLWGRPYACIQISQREWLCWCDSFHAREFVCSRGCAIAGWNHNCPRGCYTAPYRV